MAHTPEEILAEIAERHGEGVVYDPGQCGQLLRDACPDCEPQIHLLILGLRRGVARELARRRDEATCLRQVHELIREAAVPESAARWVVRCWSSVASRLDALAATQEDEPDDLATARLLLEHGDAVGAEAQLQRRLLDDPWSGPVQCLLGWILLAQDKVDSARDAFDAAVDLDESDPAAWLGLGRTHSRSEAAAAEECFRRAIALDADSGAAWRSLTRSLLRQSRCEEAVEAGVRATEADPEEASGWFLLGRAYEQTEQWERAESAYRQAADLDRRDARVCRHLGLVRLRQGWWEAAEEAFRRACQLDRQELTAWHNLGLALRRQDRLVEAEAAYRRAVEIDPEHARSHSHHGQILKELGRRDEAAAAFRRAASLDNKYALRYRRYLTDDGCQETRPA